MKTCAQCGEHGKCIEICLYVKKLIPAVEDGRNSEREVLMSPSGLAIAADLYSLSDWNGERTRTSSPKVDLGALSASERRALLLIAEGMSYAETGKALGVSRSTVQSYVARARAKLAVQNRHIVQRQKTAETEQTTGGARMSTRVRHSAGNAGRKTAAEKAAGGVKKTKKVSPRKAAAPKVKAKGHGQNPVEPVFDKGSYDPGVIKTGTDINNDGI